MSASCYEGISNRWSDEVRKSRDYKVIRNDNCYKAGFYDSFIFESEYQDIRDYIEKIKVQYEGIPFEHCFQGDTLSTPAGMCYRIQSVEKIPQREKEQCRIKEHYLSDLTLVFGIGKKTAEVLHGKGCRSIRDLLRIRQFREEAAWCLKIIEESDPENVNLMLSKRHRSSHPYALLSSDLFTDRDTIFLDIETLGLFSRPIILFGIAIEREGSLLIEQYLLREIAEEPASISAVLEFLYEKPVLVTYNGKSFDIPYIKERASFYGFNLDISLPHYDMLHVARSRYKNELNNCRLSTIEREVLGIFREHDIPGVLVPELYEEFLNSGNSGLLIPLIEHNRQDLISLALLFHYIKKETYEGR